MAEKKKEGYQKETMAVHGLWQPSESERSLIPPIDQGISYWFKDTEEAEDLFASRKEGLIYGRITNKSVFYFEKAMAALEGAEAGLATASGMAAINLVMKHLTSSGDEILSSKKIYGGTFHLFNEFLPKDGVKTNFVEDPNNPGEWLARVNKKTKVLFVETPANPNSDIVDLLMVRDVARISNYYRIPLVVDSTLATPILLNPIKYGAEIVIHSATKYISSGSVLSGIILGKKYFIDDLRQSRYRETGPSMVKESAVELLKRLETLPLRMKAHSENALKVAEHLAAHPKVERVNFSGLPVSPYYDLTRQYMKNGCGALFSFDIKGEEKNARKFIENLKLIRHAANLGEARTLAIHPASTTHGKIPEEERKKIGILPTTVRLSIGLESRIDIIEDINQSLKI